MASRVFQERLVGWFTMCRRCWKSLQYYHLAILFYFYFSSSFLYRCREGRVRGKAWLPATRTPSWRVEINNNSSFSSSSPFLLLFIYLFSFPCYSLLDTFSFVVFILQQHNKSRFLREGWWRGDYHCPFPPLQHVYKIRVDLLVKTLQSLICTLLRFSQHFFYTLLIHLLSSQSIFLLTIFSYLPIPQFSFLHYLSVVVFS